jgi:hypothetical protein
MDQLARGIPFPLVPEQLCRAVSAALAFEGGECSLSWRSKRF